MDLMDIWGSDTFGQIHLMDVMAVMDFFVDLENPSRQINTTKMYHFGESKAISGDPTRRCFFQVRNNKKYIIYWNPEWTLGDLKMKNNKNYVIYWTQNLTPGDSKMRNNEFIIFLRTRTELPVTSKWETTTCTLCFRTNSELPVTSKWEITKTYIIYWRQKRTPGDFKMINNKTVYYLLKAEANSRWLRN